MVRGQNGETGTFAHSQMSHVQGLQNIGENGSVTILCHLVERVTVIVLWRLPWVSAGLSSLQ